MKVITIVGTRPEIIRLSCIIKKLDQYFDHVLVHTGQNWDPKLNDVFFKDLDLRQPDHCLNIVGKNLGESMGNIISQSYDLFLDLKPDAILILGDTNSALSAISAKRLKIPIFHMEAGNRCFDQVVPEEINRKIVDHISDINLPYTEHSRRHLLAEGCRPDHIFVTGSPLTEVYETYHDKIQQAQILSDLKLKSQQYILWSTHREENLDIESNWIRVVQCVNAVAERYSDQSIIMSTHPRTQKKITEKGIQFAPNVKIHQPFGLFDFLQLQTQAYCVISDSGTISEEAAILNVPAISFRICTERPEAIDKGNLILSGLDSKHLLDAIDVTVRIHQDNRQNGAQSYPSDYLDKNVSSKIAKLILSYVPVINQTIWRKTT
jgi:UDP-N-acetylglucosamine 2-epimerase